jgi:hypothetical protein
MIWFKMSLEKETLDSSEELTQKVKELLDVDDTGEVLFINENEIEAEDRFWEEYEEWEYDLLSEGMEEEPLEVDGRTVIVITTVDDEKVVQIQDSELPVWYVKSA